MYSVVGISTHFIFFCLLSSHQKHTFHYGKMFVIIKECSISELILDLGNRMTFMQRVKNFAVDLLYTIMMPRTSFGPQTEVIRKKFPGTPSIMELFYTVSSAYDKNFSVVVGKTNANKM